MRSFGHAFSTLSSVSLGLFALLVLCLGAPALAQDPGSPRSPLITAEALKTKLGTAGLVVLDIRSAIDGSDAETYARGHVPGALHSDYDKAGWRVTRNGLPFMLPSVAQLEKLIGELGIDEDSQVVVIPAGVSATDFGAAARVYWTLKLTGVRNLSILDGGYAAWVAAKYPVETGTNTPSPTIFTATIDNSIVAEASDVARISASGQGALVDARPPLYFDGKIKADAAAAYGHIPGAISIDSANFYDDRTNRLKTPAEVAAIASKIPAQGPVVNYCNTGHWSATNWFVLSELLGRKDVKEYYGSMVDWAADSKRPVTSSRTKWDDIKKFFGQGS
jgi:thiosulfate/3-mercaptopyruvate sulfurtransferase